MKTNPPEFLFLSINEVCNLRCQHCDYWRTAHPALDTIGLDRQEELLAELAELSPNGKVVICGGEPTLEVGTYFRVCSVSRRLGLRTLSVVNGTTIANLACALRMTTLGPDEISVSLDGPTADIHDRMRGRKGAFAQATNALRLLLDARLISGSPVRIYAMGLLTKSTSVLLDEFYDLVLRQIGADKLKLNALQPSFLHTRIGQPKKSDDVFAAESQVDADALESSLARCCEKYALGFNPHWVRQVVGYFRGLNGKPDLDQGWRGGFVTDEHICNSPERNIMVDLGGRASLCFSTAFPRTPLEKPGDMRRFWEENATLKTEMGRCRALCGISHSVRREHSTSR
jgi:MoaA/NifB/PqqE/SkfB family radical SAM enzyme